MLCLIKPKIRSSENQQMKHFSERNPCLNSLSLLPNRTPPINPLTLIMKNTPKTAIDICNAALKKLGEPDAFLISSLNPNGVLASRLCYMHYHPARREVLCATKWKFAFRTVDLQSGKKSFTLPKDCLRVHDVSAPDWCLRGRSIICDARNITVTYTADVEDVEQFEELFIEALATRLACKLCIPMLNSTKTLQNQREQYTTLIDSCR